MTRIKGWLIPLSWVLMAGMVSATCHAFPTIYPTGTTIYDPDRAWNGYTIFRTPDDKGVVLIDMNGNIVRRWTDVVGLGRILPGGDIVGSSPRNSPDGNDGAELVQVDWNGNLVWNFDKTEQMETADRGTVWSARLHHDWQREGLPAGYYAPESSPAITGGRTLILAHQDVSAPEISARLLIDDRILEVSPEGEVLWDWLASNHIDEMGFSEAARRAIYQSGAAGRELTTGVDMETVTRRQDWLHINSATYVGPNGWYDVGDERFHPDNVIFSSRHANFVGIIARSGDIIWRMGPDFRETEALQKIGQVIGQHHAHVIPVGLPGAGHVMVFDNGGGAGYGEATPVALDGRNIVARHSTRVLEINPITMETVWEYSISGHGSFRFFSWNVGAAQRLPNGNTLITEGAPGRAFEVTVDGEIVWEYISPFYFESDETRQNIYRAFRVPYDWIPQLDRPEERAVVPPHPSEFHIEPN